MTTTAWVLIGLAILLVLLPPKYDPAIRLKKWVMGPHEDKDT